jgi:hypothetical protein
VRAYVDSSVALRVMMRQSDALKATADRILDYRVITAALADKAELVAIDESGLELAQGEFSAPLKSLDAIHLASAIWWRDRHHLPLAFATHDAMLARAAGAAGFEVLGA